MKKFLRKSGGFSTVEMLVSFAILILAFSGLIVVVFGNDSFAIDSQLNSEALFYAERDLNEARAQSESDFLGFVGFTGTADSGRYTITTTSTAITPCKNLLESTASWNPTILRAQHVTLQSVVASLEEFAASGGDCADEPQDAWKNPATLSGINTQPPGSGATDVDILDGYAYLTSDPGADPKEDFFVVDVTNPSIPSMEGLLDIGDGLNALDVAGNYAYVANNATSSQLLVIDITVKSAPNVVASGTLVGVDPGGSYPEGRSVYYYDGRVYVGTNETAGPEFHVFDVTVPSNPIHLGSLELTHNVHDIVVRDNLAYLATSDNSGELMVVDVSNPGAMEHPDTTGMKFNAAGSGGNEADGSSLYLLGNKAYLGLKRNPGNPDALPDFYIIDVTNPAGMTELGSKNLGMQTSKEVTGIAVSGDLAFLSTNDSNAQFQVWNIKDPANIINCVVWDYSAGASPTGLDFDGTYIYTSNTDNLALRIIYDNP
jgi:hypothetical protein